MAIPGSLIATFAVMRALDFTMNNVTMLALVLMVGVVIDDASSFLKTSFARSKKKGCRRSMRPSKEHERLAWRFWPRRCRW